MTFMHARSLLLLKKNVCRHGRTTILTDSARKRNSKEVFANCNKTSINIGHQHNCWKELMKAFRDQTDAEVPLCMCFEYWDRHNNYAGRQAAYKKQQKYMFFGQISPNNILYSCFEGIY